ncbi:MAG: response regulator [Marinobacterium sp.]|nr:response regulator [Marinobacterium sp.]
MTAPWKILVVDDEEGIHGITRMIFRGYTFEQRPIELISAMSAAQAREQLATHSDIALILLDVVMETDDAGLQLVEYIRQQQGNRHVRIILRTGHPGYAPEADVIVNYDINDYLSKAELSASRLLTAVVVALRAYRDIASARHQHEQQHSSSAPLQLAPLAQQLLQQSSALLRQSQRLQRLELSASARDLAGDLLGQQQRLHNSCLQLQPPARTTPQSVELMPLCEQLINTFLPQARREGWILDYQIRTGTTANAAGEHTSASIQSQPDALQQLLMSALELAIARANGEDLKLSLNLDGQSDQLDIDIEQSGGQPGCTGSDWHQLLQQNCQTLCQQLGGHWTGLEQQHCRFSVQR